MIQTLSVADIDRFRDVIARCLGLQFEDAKLGFLADVLRRRLAAAGQAADVYLSRLETDSFNSEEVGALAQELTVPETYFFRNTDQYRAFAETALPDRMRAQSAVRRLKILSAGCASGEEAYSLALLVRETVDPSWDVSIRAVDVNPAMVSKASRARYSAWALRETPADVQQRWFRSEGRDFVLDDGVRAAVKFEVRNLAQNDSQLWLPDTYDVIFFRNVLMYFTPQNGHTVITRIERSLRNGGYLFLGHAETLRGLSSDFHLRHTHGTFYYQRKDSNTPSALPFSVTASQAPQPPLTPALDAADSWVEAIRLASERIETLTALPRQRPRPQPGPSPAAAMRASDLELALGLLREERFAEALEMMQSLPPESGRDPDALLLHAALLTHRGRLAEAEDACRRVLEVDELNAGAHYLFALCREGARDRAGALYHDQVAIYLDPSFAMPRLHLGLLARRVGDRTTAQKELGQALLLLQREDGSRVLLFGGGFGRETLVALCRTELVSCGGKP